jgi:hypothetical protein
METHYTVLSLSYTTEPLSECMLTSGLERECDSIHCLTTGYVPLSSTESIPVILSLIVILGRKWASWIEFRSAGPQSQHTVTPRILPLPPRIPYP